MVYRLLEAFGVRVVEVDDLPDTACMVRSQRIVLIRAGLDPETRDVAVSHLLPLAAEATARGRPLRPPR